jgi:hypothetical protein
MDACARVYEDAQQGIRAGALLKSRSELSTCEKLCPSTLARDCATWREDVERQIPTLRLSAIRVDGADPGVVRVIIDNTPLAEPLSGAPIDVDPGKHVLTFEAATRHRVEVSVDVPRGRKGYAVEVSFPVEAARVETAAPEPRSAPPWAPLMVSGVGLAALAAGGVLGFKGQLDKIHLVNTCAPHCQPAQVSAIDGEWKAAAGLAAAGGSVALAGMLWWLLDGRARAAHAAPALSLGPRWIALSGRF